MFFIRAESLQGVVRLEIDESEDVLNALDNFLKMRIMTCTNIETLSIHTADTTRVLHNEIARAVVKGYAAGSKWDT